MRVERAGDRDVVEDDLQRRSVLVQMPDDALGDRDEEPAPVARLLRVGGRERMVEEAVEGLLDLLAMLPAKVPGSTSP